MHTHKQTDIQKIEKKKIELSLCVCVYTIAHQNVHHLCSNEVSMDVKCWWPLFNIVWNELV